MKRVNFWRGIFILIMAAFFGFRYWQLGSWIYPLYFIIFVGIGLLSLSNTLASRWQNITLNVGITLFFLDLVFAKIDLSQVGQALLQADYGMMMISFFFVLIHLFFRTLRWQWLLKSLGEVSFWPAFRGLVIGITGNTLLPARAGEFLRAYILGRSTGLAKTGVFATLVVERIFDGLTVLAVLLVVMVLGVRDEQLQTAGFVGAIFFVGALGGLIIFMTQRHWADMLIKKFLPHHLADRILNLLDGFGSGLAVLKKPRQLGMVFLWNLLTWLMIPISFWFALLALDFGTPIPWPAPVLLLPALALGLTIPGPPGGVGVVQAATAYTLHLTFQGLPVASNFNEVVAAASILIHFSQVIPEVLPGLISFFIEGLSMDDISAGREMAEQVSSDQDLERETIPPTKTTQ